MLVKEHVAVFQLVRLCKSSTLVCANIWAKSAPFGVHSSLPEVKCCTCQGDATRSFKVSTHIRVVIESSVFFRRSGEVTHRFFKSKMGARNSKTSPGVREIGAKERFPDGVVFEAYPENQKVTLDELLTGRPVNIQELLAGKKTILLGVPGAFTPNCTSQHVPSYVSAALKFFDAGIDQILCLGINDVFVMKNWCQQLGAEGKIRMLSDPRAELAQKLGLALDLRNTLGRVVYKRFSAIVLDGVVDMILVEPDGTGLQCTLAGPMMHQLKTNFVQVA